jgi:hypothetical protein
MVDVVLVVVEAIQVVMDVETHRIKSRPNFLLVKYVAGLIMQCLSVTSGLILHSWEKRRASTQQTPMGQTQIGTLILEQPIMSQEIYRSLL